MLDPDAGAPEPEAGRTAQDRLDRLVRRLGSLSPAAWRTRREPVLRCLDRLAELGRVVEDRPAYAVPDLPDHALADAVRVLAEDVLHAAGRTSATAEAVADVVHEAWQATR